MAYLNHLAAITEEQVCQLQRHPRARVRPVHHVAVSHLIAYEFPQAPLSGFLRQALDGGEPLHADYWHPLRVPVVHHAEGVDSLARLLRLSAQRLVRAQRAEIGDWHWSAAEQVIRLFVKAAEAELAVVSVLEPPPNWLEARRVWIPLELPRT